MKAKVGFFYEKEGVKSSMRLQSFIALVAAIALGAFAVWTKQLDVNVIAMVTLFVVAAFAPKSVQKYAELKEQSK